MATTITIVAGAKTKEFEITTANQQRIIAAIEKHGFSRDPDNTGTYMNDFDYFISWLKSQYVDLVFRAERRGAGQAIPSDDGLLT